jgi:cell division protein FtsW (lipid II flippase)
VLPTLIEINPNRSGPKLLLFIAINLGLILFLAFDRRIVSLIDMKIVILLSLFLYSMNFFLTFDLYHRFNYEDFFSERLSLIPLLVLIFLIFADSIRRKSPYFLISLGLMGMQLAISKMDPGMNREHAFYIVLLAALAWPPLVAFFKNYGLKLRYFENLEFGEYWVMLSLLLVGVPFAWIFGEAVQIGGFRLELSSLMKLPFIYYYALCFDFAYDRHIKRGEFGTYLSYMFLFTIPVFTISLLSKDQGSFMLFVFFTVIMIIFFFPAPDKGDARSRRRTEIRLKTILAVSILILFAGLLLAGKHLSNSKIGFLDMITDLYARTLHPSSDLLSYETSQYQMNLVGQTRWIGSTSFEVDRAMLAPYLVNDYIFVYLLPRMGFLCGAVIIAAYVALFLFGWLGLRSVSGYGHFESSRLFFIIGLSYFVFQSLYQLISQLGAKGLPFTGKEVYLLSAGRSQAIVFILFLALLNNIVSRDVSRGRS